MKIIRKSDGLVCALALAGAAGSSAAYAGPVTTVEGSGGGGLTTWALLAQERPVVSATYVDVDSYTHRTLAVLGSPVERIELSYARMTFDSGSIGLGNVDMDVFGVKYKLLDMSESLATVSVGVQHKINHDLPGATMAALGIEDDAGTDAYIAATKVTPVGGKNVLLNGTARLTRANQLGYFGFGTAADDDYEVEFEGSVGVFLNAQMILGAEYRSKPDKIVGLQEDAWWNVFAGYFVNERFSVVAAYANLGDIAAEITPDGDDQAGLYLQAQFNF